MAGHKLRIGNVQVIVRADAVILQRIQAAAKLPLYHDGVQPRRAERLVEGCKLRCAHGLVQHLRDDLLLDGGEQRRVFRSGIGLPQFCDIGLWARAYHSEIDWQRLHEQCESVHAATFAAAAFRIARDDLGICFDLPALWSDAVDAEPLLHDSLCGGVYGSNDLTRLHSSTVTLNAVKASRTGEKSSVLSTVFPKRAYLERRYPYLKKRPYMLPVAWVQRLAHYAKEKQSGADSSASGSIKLARERIELMKRYGVMD